MEVRTCTERDLQRLRDRWPTSDDVAGHHYDQQRAGTATFLVCWQGDEPLGWALVQWSGCTGENARAAFPSGIEVNHLQVRPEFRGRGAGTAIVTAAEQMVRDRGAGQIALGVGVENADAARLYRRLGYQSTGVLDTFSYSWFDDQGGRHDEVESSELLVKRL
jgi:GNAT superfamily N-acetyltransferase